jgi:esterase/lipase
MGGAVALQTLAIEPRLKFGIIQSTFSSLEQIVYDYQQRALNGWGTHWSAHLALNSAAKLAQFDPYTVKPIEAVKQIKQPVVICHGDQDIHIPVSNGQDLFNNLKSSRKELIIVKGANHYNLGQIAGYKFYDRMNDFILSVK